MMKHSFKKGPGERTRAGIKRSLVDKNPYSVKDMPHTIVYLTPQQAAGRLDLIPQFQRQTLEESLEEVPDHGAL